MLEFVGVGKRFAPGAPVLEDFTLAVSPEETVALVGPSGSGKTTALKLANRLLDADSGEVRVFGEPVRAPEPAALRRRIGYVIQEGGLFPHWSVRENVETVPRLLGWPEEKRRARAEALLETVGLPPGEFSRAPAPRSSRAASARGSAWRARSPRTRRCVLMDEPFGALDPIARRAIQREFLAWKRSLSAAVLLVTHDLAEAFRLADRIAVLHRGRIRQVGTPDDLRRRPADAFVREFVQEFVEPVETAT